MTRNGRAVEQPLTAAQPHVVINSLETTPGEIITRLQSMVAFFAGVGKTYI